MSNSLELLLCVERLSNRSQKLYFKRCVCVYCLSVSVFVRHMYVQGVHSVHTYAVVRGGCQVSHSTTSCFILLKGYLPLNLDLALGEKLS